MKLKIKELRLKKNLTQDELCELSGTKKRSLLDYESGKTDVPFSKVHNIAIALGVTIYDLIDDDTIQTGVKNVSSSSEADQLRLESYNLLVENNKLQSQAILLLKEKVELLEQQLEQSENEKKLQANVSKVV